MSDESKTTQLAPEQISLLQNIHNEKSCGEYKDTVKYIVSCTEHPLWSFVYYLGEDEYGITRKALKALRDCEKRSSTATQEDIERILNVIGDVEKSLRSIIDEVSSRVTKFLDQQQLEARHQRKIHTSIEVANKIAKEGKRVLFVFPKTDKESGKSMVNNIPLRERLRNLSRTVDRIFADSYYSLLAHIEGTKPDIIVLDETCPDIFVQAAEDCDITYLRPEPKYGARPTTTYFDMGPSREMAKEANRKPESEKPEKHLWDHPRNEPLTSRHHHSYQDLTTFLLHEKRSAIYTNLINWHWSRPVPNHESALLLIFLDKNSTFAAQICVTDDDEPEIRAYLKSKLEHWRKVWEPLL